MESKINKAFEKWKKYVTRNLIARTDKDIFTAGYKEGVKDEKKRISDGLRALEKK